MKTNNDKIGVKGRIIIFRKENDKMIKLFEKNNLIVNSGLDFLPDLMSNGNILGYCAVGTGTTLVTINDINLETELYRVPISETSGAGLGVWRCDSLFAPIEANGTWKEAGLFKNGSGSPMFNRVNIDFTKISNETIIVRFEITFSR